MRLGYCRVGCFYRRSSIPTQALNRRRFVEYLFHSQIKTTSELVILTETCSALTKENRQIWTENTTRRKITWFIP
jgi:hypothetical protein